MYDKYTKNKNVDFSVNESKVIYLFKNNNALEQVYKKQLEILDEDFFIIIKK